MGKINARMQKILVGMVAGICGKSFFCMTIWTEYDRIEKEENVFGCENKKE